MHEDLIKLKNTGMTWVQIDKHLGLSKGTSWARAKRAGLLEPKKRWTKEDEQFLILNRNKLGLKKVSEILGFTYDRVRKESSRISSSFGRMQGYPVNKPKKYETGECSYKDTYHDPELSDWENIYVDTGQLYFDF